MKETTKLLAKHFINRQQDLIENAMLKYGTVITKDGRILTVEEMKSLTLLDK